MSAIALKPIRRVKMSFGIVGTSPLVTHKWSEKAKREMREKQGGKKTRSREARDPAAEAKAATYVTDDGDYGIPAMALKKAIVGAAHKDIGIEKTLVRKALFLMCDDSNMVIKISSDPPIVREDQVRVGAGSADMRYRPEFRNWSCRVDLEVDAELLTDEDILSLVDRAGFGVGICEMRPEKGGEFGRFSIDRTSPVSWEPIVD